MKMSIYTPEFVKIKKFKRFRKKPLNGKNLKLSKQLHITEKVWRNNNTYLEN